MKTQSERHPVDVHAGQKIRERRKEIGMSQETLAGELGVTFQAVQKYEKAESRVLISRLSDIARALDVPVSYFFDGASSAD